MSSRSKEHLQIVTHGGRAHFDEFLAIALILASQEYHECRIERRDAKTDELNDPGIWVVDIGSRYQPELLNFDHHQDLSIPASFVLVAQHLGLNETLKRAGWWDFKDRMDRFGPFNTGREMGAGSLLPTISPLEEWILAEFEEDPASVDTLMRRFGSSMIEQARKLEERWIFWESCKSVRIKGILAIIAPTDDSDGSQEFRDAMEEPASIAITYDRRGDGWRLYRFNDVEGVDFSRLESHPAISFAHKGGFIAKTHHRIDLDEVLKLVELAVE